MADLEPANVVKLEASVYTWGVPWNWVRILLAGLALLGLVLQAVLSRDGLENLFGAGIVGGSILLVLCHNGLPDEGLLVALLGRLMLAVLAGFAAGIIAVRLSPFARPTRVSTPEKTA